MAQVVTLEWPREGVALITMSNPTIRNHGSREGVGQLADALVQAREAGARVRGSRVTSGLRRCLRRRLPG